ncbi:Hpt domain-containing protein [Desulfovibrio sp. OttesenSCG-928-I05]|nr:Hpt domain-containing protein [Desulfovibrio sp. OttesenSCG-928-I05]
MNGTTHGLDTEGALKRLAGNTKLYTKLLGQFHGSYGGAADEIQSQVASGDMNTAERTSHTIKGLAGTLGATNLQTVAARLEALCREASDTAGIASTLEEFKAELAGAMDDIAAYLGPAEGGAPAAQPGPAAQAAPRAELDQSKLAALFVLLEDDDAEANLLYKDIRPALVQRHPGIVSALDRSIEGFDYGQALSLLRTVFPS